MIKRHITDKLVQLSKKFPVVTITGPRQSGKTTLVKHIFSTYHYVSLENPERRYLAKSDPQAFLNQFKSKVIIDEIQHVPELLSYIQEIVDHENEAGRFILTGSQSLLMLEKITQSLAGRTALLKLLPLSIPELNEHYKSITNSGYVHLLYSGFYPGLYDKNILPMDFYSAYFETYVQRDVRQIQNIRDLDLFSNFIRLCAGRVGQILDYSSIAGDLGASVNTIKAWISILQSSYIIFLLQPYYKNLNKRIVKSPKLYFTDPGLASFLLNISSSDQISNHYLRGGLFENMILAELLKYRLNNGFQPNMYYYRDNNQNEIDCIIENANRLDIIEIKSAQTFSDSFFKTLHFWSRNFPGINARKFLIYGGEITQQYQGAQIVSWKDIRLIYE